MLLVLRKQGKADRGQASTSAKACLVEDVLKPAVLR
jgi:hypothetical protein